MHYIDTHTHLYSDTYDNDRNEMISRAFQAGVSKLLLPAIDRSYYEAMIKLEAQYPAQIYSMIGLHPCEVKAETYEAELDFIAEKLAERSFVAIGEIGLDLYWDKTTLELQEKVFRQQLQWAKTYKLPINIHCRSAFEPLLKILEQETTPDLNGVLHCFSGSIPQAQRAIACNMKLGIGGVITFKNNKLASVLNQIPLENIVLETDAPYLAPSPHRGKRNESSYIPLIAAQLATIYQLDLTEIARITSQNAQAIYSI